MLVLVRCCCNSAIIYHSVGRVPLLLVFRHPLCVRCPTAFGFRGPFTFTFTKLDFYLYQCTKLLLLHVSYAYPFLDLYLHRFRFYSCWSSTHSFPFFVVAFVVIAGFAVRRLFSLSLPCTSHAHIKAYYCLIMSY